MTVTDGDGEAITAPLTVTVKPEDAVVAYAGDTLSSGQVLLRARLQDSDDGAPGDIAKATVTFKEGSKTLCAGSLSCTVTLPNGAHVITVEAGGYYTGSAQATVRVYTSGGKVFRISAESGKGTIALSLWDGDALLYEQTEKALAGGFVTIR